MQNSLASLQAKTTYIHIHNHTCTSSYYDYAMCSVTFFQPNNTRVHIHIHIRCCPCKFISNKTYIDTCMHACMQAYIGLQKDCDYGKCLHTINVYIYTYIYIHTHTYKVLSMQDSLASLQANNTYIYTHIVYMHIVCKHYARCFGVFSAQ